MKNFSNDRGFKNFNDRGFGGGNRGRSFGGNRGGFNRGREDRQMFSAICDQCGAECELPFRPTGDKPVYCSDCFEKNGGRDNGNKRRFESRDTKDYQRDNTRVEIEAINQKLDKILAILNSSKEVTKTKKAKKVEAVIETTEE